MNYLPIILSIFLTIAALIVYLKERHIEKEKNSRLYSVPTFIIAFVLIWGNFAFQVYKDSKRQSELRDSNNLLKDNSRTINSLSEKLDKSIEEINNLNKQKKIDLLKNLRNEIKNNIILLKEHFLENKVILMDNESVLITNTCFSVLSIEKNISEGTITDETLLKDLYDICEFFNVKNKLLENARHANTIPVKTDIMGVFFRNLDKHILYFEEFCERLEKYIKQIDK